MKTRLRHGWLAISLLPQLLVSRQQRQLLGQMRAFCRHLPGHLQQPLPQAMQQLTTNGRDHRPLPLSENSIRNLADLAILLERRSPLGICLRRSLTRYYYLRPAGVPVTVHFGAKLIPNKSAQTTADKSLTGHAWLTLNGRPYHEADENWQGFTVMFSWPDE